MRVLMLAPWMKMGHGVSVTIACLAPEFRRLGLHPVVGCLGHDGHFSGLEITEIPATAGSVAGFVQRRDIDAVVALGSPYFEVLPFLPEGVRTMAYEAGDPTPELFESDAIVRRRIAENKIANVYPHLDVVAAISEFIRHDIGWPNAAVVIQGIDNIPDAGPKPVAPPGTFGPLRVGALTRLGVGEAHYKGGPQLLALKECLDELRVPVAVDLMGRGTPRDAEPFLDRGFRVHLNASDAERDAYLREIDVFVSTSLWEGTNLPLVEAQAVGTPGLAFDIGAHPEFTPLLFRSPRDMAHQISAYAGDRSGLLVAHGRICYHHVRDTMRWSATAESLAGLLQADRVVARRMADHPHSRRRRGPASVVRSLKYEGVAPTAAKVLRSLGRVK